MSNYVETTPEQVFDNSFWSILKKPSEARIVILRPVQSVWRFFFFQFR